MKINLRDMISSYNHRREYEPENANDYLRLNFIELITDYSEFIQDILIILRERYYDQYFILYPFALEFRDQQSLENNDTRRDDEVKHKNIFQKILSKMRKNKCEDTHLK